MIQKLNDNLKTLSAEASKFSVIPDVHDEDMMFLFLLESIALGDFGKAAQIYFGGGAEDAEKIMQTIRVYAPNESWNILEFASGFGRVSRHFKQFAPEANFTCMDIHPKAVSFLENLGLEAFVSSDDPDNVFIQKTFDVVFALSFFSHLPKDSFRKWLSSLWSKVDYDGLLIFTTHGEVSAKHFPEFNFDEEGFFYFAVSEQKDLETDLYGSTITLEKFVTDSIDLLPDVVSVDFSQGAWWGHQDLFVIKKRSKNS